MDSVVSYAMEQIVTIFQTLFMAKKKDDREIIVSEYHPLGVWY